MRRMAMSEKIKPHHLERKAMLYVRQSSAYQVAHNLESQKLQYAMENHLHQLRLARGRGGRRRLGPIGCWYCDPSGVRTYGGRGLPRLGGSSSSSRGIAFCP